MAKMKAAQVTKAEPLDEPLGVVPRDELGDEPVHLGEVLEAKEIQALLLEGAHEALEWTDLTI